MIKDVGGWRFEGRKNVGGSRLEVRGLRLEAKTRTIRNIIERILICLKPKAKRSSNGTK